MSGQAGGTGTGTPLHHHLMAIGGVGMSALARLLRADGHHVSGCDQQPSPYSRALEAEGVRVHIGHDPAHLEGVDVLVVSSAFAETHPEIQAAHARAVPVLRRLELLGRLLAAAPSVGVTGTHGKTTTSSMLSSLLLAADQDPWCFVGAYVPALESNARFGRGLRVAEIDESDPRFQEVVVQTAVLTNLEDDHIGAGEDLPNNYHATFEDLIRATERFARSAERVVYNAEWPLLERITEGHPQRVGFGEKIGTYQARELTLSPTGSTFQLYRADTFLAPVTLSVPGRHNAWNALAALSAALECGAPLEPMVEALSRFRGAERRFEQVGTYRGAPVIDDYAHHPTEVRAVIAAAQATGRRVRLVFQPHRYGRTQQMWERFAESLVGPDEVIVLDIFSASEKPIPGVHSRLIADHLQAHGHPGVWMTWEDTERHLRATTTPEDLLLFVGAGDIYQLALRLAAG